MADHCNVNRCQAPNCRMPLPNRYYHAVLSGTIDHRFCSGRCLRNWRRSRTDGRVRLASGFAYRGQP
jgi:hypothetical protein